MIYSAVNVPVFEAIPASARRVLDVGCGAGSLGAALKRRQPCQVFGVTGSSEEAMQAAKVLNGIEVGDLESREPPARAGIFDVIVCSHVLEHLRDPAAVLRRLRRVADERTQLIVALPNILHWRQRLVFLRGEFAYSDGGLMDRTHLRFFGWESSKRLIPEGGWVLTRASAAGRFPLLWRVPRLGRFLDRAGTRIIPALLGDQFVLIGQLGE